MAVFLPCSCGHRLPANATTLAPGARCPVCGRDVGDRSLIVEPEPIEVRHVEVIDPKPLRGFNYKVVEVDSVPPSREPPPAPERPIDWQTPTPSDGIPYGVAWTDPEVRRPHDDIERLRDARRRMRDARIANPQVWNSWEREKNGLDCLAYPMRAWSVIAVLAFFLTLGQMTVAFILRLAAEGEPLIGYIIAIPIAIAFALLVSIWLRVTVLSGEAGECNLSLLNRFDFPAFVMTMVSGLLSLVGGPILAFGMAGWFWMTAGNLTLVDRFILVLLGTIGYAWWIAGALAAHDSERLVAVHPAAIAQVIARRGVFIVYASFAGGFVLALTSWWIIECHLLMLGEKGNPALAFFLAILFWANGLFWLTFLARWLGLQRFWNKMPALGRV